jgi:hypothetical protein
VEGPSDVLDNVKSRRSKRNSAIIMAAGEKASRTLPCAILRAFSLSDSGGIELGG